MDTNNAARTVVLAGLGKVPTAGVVLSSLAAIFWPVSGEDVWGQIRARVEALINQRIAETVYQQVSEDLTGLRNVINDYTTAMADSQANPNYLSDKYIAALSHFEHDLPHFQSHGYEVLLLPLFTQFANLHLSLLRDGFNNGAKWGWTPMAVQDEKKKLKKAVADYADYAWQWAQTGYNQVQLPGDSTYRVENWRAQNAYVRQMNLDVVDHRYYWGWYDPDVAASQPLSNPTRTIFSNPIGTADDSGIYINPAFFAFSAPTAPITGLNVWAWNYLDAVQVAYGSQWGPRQGDQPTADFGGSNQRPHGWSGNIDPVNNPIVRVSGHAGQLPDGTEFWFKDGSSTGLCGRNGGGAYDYQYEGHVLSSLYIMGTSNYYRSANCLILGFRLANSY